MNLQCTICGKEFNRRASVRGRQVIWVRKQVRMFGEWFLIRGPVCATDNDKLNDHLVMEA